jgi:hypothetical protein
MMLIGILDWAIGIVLCCSVILFLGIVAMNASRPLSYVAVAPQPKRDEQARTVRPPRAPTSVIPAT